ncbi:MAG: hypothetical protein HYS73_01060 [Parcubacteria group bacterium]|nr:hypothetical protein [Parcubacteria group bacterium]
MLFSDITPTIIAVSIGIILGAAMGYFFLPYVKESLDEKGGKKRKILELIEARGAVSSADVEKYLAVLPEEALKELKELIQRGVVRETHRPGTSALYYESTTKKK